MSKLEIADCLIVVKLLLHIAIENELLLFFQAVASPFIVAVTTDAIVRRSPQLPAYGGYSAGVEGDGYGAPRADVITADTYV